ncbi:MAG: glycosyltransferase family 2 protein [Eubacteriales bacterium]
MLSCVIPCYNEEEVLGYFYEEIKKIAEVIEKTNEIEFIFVDDGSKDKTLSVLKTFAKEDKRVKYLSFSRNFGKESAMYAGLKASLGDFVVLMDADMQDPPSLLPDMLKILEDEELDSVATRRVTRKGEPPIRSFFARKFYKIINKISDVDIVDGARDYRMMRRSMVDAILSMEEYNRFSKGIFGWVGFRTHWLPYENVERMAGETKWSFWKLFLYSLQGIIAFSVVPLAIASVTGLIFCCLAIALGVFVLVRTLLYGDPVAGWPSMICIITFLGGLQLFCIGILSQYLAKTYLETKKRPIYILREESPSPQVKES